MRKIIKYIENSNKSKELLNKIKDLEELKNNLQVALDVRTRWNPTFKMLKRALELKEEPRMVKENSVMQKPNLIRLKKKNGQQFMEFVIYWEVLNLQQSILVLRIIQHLLLHFQFCGS